MSAILTCERCGAKNRVSNVPDARVPACARCGAALPWLHAGTDASFEADVRAPVPVLVDFWAPWCGPCRVIAPVLEDMAREYAGKLRIVKVNVDENPGASARFGVQGIPTLIVFRGGEPTDRIVGAVNKPTLVDRLGLNRSNG
ncbi:thioredoxin [Deinococcus yavapaiensis]|uniref:Thioredoxin n=1 Tax=Deinococcus yavapaiensis KR-236 TaxID=694435 RepID=A0A318S5Z4_9DEIO|nr:thioredoxin [Deinococcus yavapaiensis]PYE49959.1 thioredoxin [Deinococcus yavapaiensis KR-236]